MSVRQKFDSAAASLSLVWFTEGEAVVWSAADAAGERAWTSICQSHDGLYVAACCLGGHIWMSNDHGETWREVKKPQKQDWMCIACSDDGMKVNLMRRRGVVWCHARVWQYAAVTRGSGIWMSSDRGATWQQPTEFAGQFGD